MIMRFRERTGFTIVELGVYVVVFSMFMAMASGIFFWARKSMNATKKIDDLQDLRMASIQINNALSYGNRILYPPIDNKVYHQILLKNNRNELVAFFRDENSRLMLLNYEQYKGGLRQGLQVISKNAIEFLIERPATNLIKYSVRIVDESGVENVIANGGKMINTETNEPW